MDDESLDNESLADRLRLRRAAIGHLAGVTPHALDAFVAEKYANIIARRDERMSDLKARLDEFSKRPDRGRNHQGSTGAWYASLSHGS